MTDQEYIDKYLTDQLSKEEILAFEKRLEEDSSFASQYNQLRELQLAVETHELKSRFDNIFEAQQLNKSEDNSEVRTISIERSFRLLKYAAAVLLLISVGWLGYQDAQKGKSSLALNDIIYQDPGLPTPMSSTDKYEFFDAMVDYKSNNFLEAYNKWTLLDPDSTNDTIVYYRSMALLNNEKFDEAEDLLSKLKTNSPFNEKKLLYTIYILIKKNKIEEAKNEMKKIKNAHPEMFDQLNEFLTK